MTQHKWKSNNSKCWEFWGRNRDSTETSWGGRSNQSSRQRRKIRNSL